MAQAIHSKNFVVHFKQLSYPFLIHLFALHLHAMHSFLRNVFAREVTNAEYHCLVKHTGCENKELITKYM